MSELQKSIIKTLVYFDIFDYPLTVMEIYKWLYLPAGSAGQTYSLSEIQTALLSLNDNIATKDGFYFLSGRQELIAKRLFKYGLAENKFKRAIKFIKILRFIPFIKMIAVCNSLAYSNSNQTGDIDLFIITQNNRLWLTRLLTVGFLKILGVRPKAISKQDTIDANFFLSEDSLSIENLKISPNDIYLAYWIEQLVPIYNQNKAYQKFQTANDWIKKSLPNSFGYNVHDRRQVKINWLVNVGQLLLSALLSYNFLEERAKKIQLKIMPTDLKKMLNIDTRVMAGQNVLKFHREDRREEYQYRFDKTIQSLIS
ncbi:MAG: hypothetical protein WCV73_01460 [Patescibacteria group bacterium]|jgi:hypothetical protein